MNVAVVGSREYPDLEQVEHFVIRLLAKHPEAVIVSGGARGVDRTAEITALDHGADVISLRPTKQPVPMERFPGDPDLYYLIERYEWRDGDLERSVSPEPFDSFRDAAFARNTYIVKESARVVAFTIGSSGTKNTMQEARRLDRPLHEYRPRVRLA